MEDIDEVRPAENGEAKEETVREGSRSPSDKEDSVDKDDSLDKSDVIVKEELDDSMQEKAVSIKEEIVESEECEETEKIQEEGIFF